jgi:hypothetical protein
VSPRAAALIVRMSSLGSGDTTSQQALWPRRQRAYVETAGIATARGDCQALSRRRDTKSASRRSGDRGVMPRPAVDLSGLGWNQLADELTALANLGSTLNPSETSPKSPMSPMSPSSLKIAA